MSPESLFDKLWKSHVVQAQTDSTPAVIYIDLHLVHEVTSPQAFTGLRQKGLQVRRSDRTVATMDHSPCRAGHQVRSGPAGTSIKQ